MEMIFGRSGVADVAFHDVMVDACRRSGNVIA
jgi:hypothetical protein